MYTFHIHGLVCHENIVEDDVCYTVKRSKTTGLSII